MPENISIRIDGEYVPAQDGQTILEVARAGGKYIPTLCWLAGTSSVGACRLCIVEVAGVGRLLPACTTPVQDGMSVTTNSEKLTQYRRIAIEFLFSERNHQCAVCVSNNHCELQAMAQRLGRDPCALSVRLPEARRWTSLIPATCWTTIAASCARAAFASATEVEGAHVWDVSSRGIRSMIVCDMNRPWAQSSSCTNCGKCVQVCPTGALAEKGFAVDEMVKQDRNVSRLTARRGGHL